MSLFVQLLEAIAVLVPDFLTLGLVTLAFFNLYSIAKTLDIAGTLETDSAPWGLPCPRVFGHHRDQHRRVSVDFGATDNNDCDSVEVACRASRTRVIASYAEVTTC